MYMFSENYFNCKLAISNPLLQKLSVRKPFSLTHLSTALGSILISLLFSQSVVAQSFSGYCIAQQNKDDLKQKIRRESWKNNPDLNVTITMNEVEYHISVDKNTQRKLLLKKAGEKLAIDQMTPLHLKGEK